MKETGEQREAGLAAVKPCPCCGGEASADGVARFSSKHGAWWQDGTRVTVAYFVNCIYCGLNNQGIVGGHQTRDIAVAKWNRRAFVAECTCHGSHVPNAAGCPASATDAPMPNHQPAA